MGNAKIGENLNFVEFSTVVLSIHSSGCFLGKWDSTTDEKVLFRKWYLPYPFQF